MTEKLAMGFDAAVVLNAVLKRLIPAAACLGAAALPVSAHHSTAMFASDKVVMLTGTVKEFQYTNPHSFVQILVPGAGGQLVEWRIATVSPLALEGAGIGPTALQSGEKVTVRAHPVKDGGASAWLIDVKKADGTVLSVPGR
jgi:hypothetical protein